MNDKIDFSEESNTTYPNPKKKFPEFSDPPKLDPPKHFQNSIPGTTVAREFFQKRKIKFVTLSTE